MISEHQPEILTADQVLPGLIADSIKVYAFGTGVTANARLLSDIAEKSGGKYYFLPRYKSFIDAFYQAAAELTERQTIRKADYFLFEEERKRSEFIIDPSTASAIYGMSWQGSDFDLTLIAPDGRAVGRDIADPDVRFVEGPVSEFYELENPMAGIWTAEIYAKDVPVGGESVTLALYGRSSLLFDVAYDRDTYAQGDRVRVTASAADPVLDIEDPQYVREVSFTGEAVRPDGSAENLVLYDDGRHGDGTAGGRSVRR